jgi:ABC-2 type transport system permease protein
VFSRVFFYAWSRSREANTARVTRHSYFGGFLELLLRPIPQQARALVEKDVRFFFRDTSQWSQLLILGAIIIIYLYNYSVLPLEKSPMPTHQLSNLLAFINLGLTGFVVSAVAVRFAFPAVSLEGNAFWIVRTAPVRAETFLWSKFWIHAVFLTVIAEILIVFSNYLLRVDMVMMTISAATVFFMTLTLTCLSIGLGSVFPRFSHENVSQIPTGAGGFLYMVIAVLFVAAVVVLEARPVHIIITSQIQAARLETAQTLYIAVSFLMVIFLCALIAWVSMKKGMQSLLKRE